MRPSTPLRGAKVEPGAIELVKGHGLRARGKLERRRRLKDAAQQVFLERGYDGATTREIAARADVAIGTLFVYAPEKRDLLFLIMNDDLDALTASAMRATSSDDRLIVQLIDAFRPVYQYFEDKREIGRYGIREIFLFQEEPETTLGPEAVRVHERITRFQRHLAQIFERMKAAGRLKTEESGATIARALMWLHWGHIQSWFTDDKAKAEIGLKRLRRLLSMMISGLHPRADEI